jgi:hypothetical protein
MDVAMILESDEANEGKRLAIFGALSEYERTGNLAFSAREQTLRKLFQNRPVILDHWTEVGWLEQNKELREWLEKAEKVFDETFLEDNSFVSVPRAEYLGQVHVPRRQLEQRIAELEGQIGLHRLEVQGDDWIRNAAEPATFVHYLQGRKDALEKEVLKPKGSGEGSSAKSPEEGSK